MSSPPWCAQRLAPRLTKPAIVLSLLNRWQAMAKQAALANLVAAELAGRRITFGALPFSSCCTDRLNPYGLIRG
ncbi:hypothetical protein L500_1126 [Bordetella holmesii CDC-H643-BH]|uniref:Uncharacterized protein n=1 Tax=Bordetella holmesii CDC-H585-BH TaxID=1331206 RepID=A0A158M9I2_9BORD|nr:hypothetical protein L497_1052 [Bordetella holmesii CDC-H585-BH]KCV10406.1 hypothetical protein L502_1079 [Bordetella holmesii CDC-H785-BH]KCV19594.1 hypothetical protein L500_1126 [Bordetella holmesii CDC-H643-BH]